MRSSPLRVTALVTVAALSACSGSGAPSGPIPSRAPIATSSAPASASSTTRATFVVHWPSAAQAAAATKRRKTISPSTQSISVTVNGGSPTVVNKPTLTGSPSTTSVTIYAPPGDDGFTFTAWDHLDASGNVLDQSTVNQTIVADANNTVSVVLDGVCAALVPSLAQTGIYVEAQNTTVPLASGSRTILKSARIVGPASKTFQFTRIDADGNTVLTSGDVSPISVVESGSTPHVTIAPAAAGPSNTMFTLTPLGPEPDGFSTTITASTSDCTGTQAFPSSFQVSTSAAVLVADSSAGILAYDQDGTQLGTAPIYAKQNIHALAYSPKSSGYLVAIEQNTGNGGGIAFQTLTISGSVIGSSTFTPQNDSSGVDTVAATESPGNIVYDPGTGNFFLALRAAKAGTTGSDGLVEEYSISGSTATFVSNFGFPDDPFSLAVTKPGYIVFDDLYNHGTTSQPSYLTTQVDDLFAGYDTITSLEPTTSLSYDSTRGTVLILDGSGAGTFTSAFAGEVTEFTPFDIPQTQYNFGAYYVSAYNPGNDELFMFSGNYAAGLSGATVAAGGSTTSNLPAGAFPNITSPYQAVVLP